MASAAGARLGAPLPPFFVHVDVDVQALALPAAAALAAASVLAPRVLDARLSPRAVAAALLAATLALRVSLSLAQGPDGWYAVFGPAPEAANEYLPALPALRLGTGTFLDRFAELAPTLPIHPSAHPPGLLMLLHWTGIDSAQALAALVIVAGGLTAPLTYVLGRLLADEPTARTAGVLAGIAPSALLYGATSADALFATLGLAAACGLVARGWPARAVGAALLAVASFFSYALLGAGAFAAIVVLRRDGLRAAAGVALACTAAVAALYGGLAIASGYDAIGALAAAGDAYRLGIANARPYAFWVLGSPAAFLVALGPPIAWLGLRALRAGGHAAVATAVVIAGAALLGFTKAETERIWLFLVPFACLAAANALPAARLRPVAAALCAQALATELLMETIW